MRCTAWVVLGAALAGLAAGAGMTLSVRREAAAWELRRARLEERRAQLKTLEARMERLEVAFEAAEARRQLLQRAREDQAAAVALLSAMGVALDPRVEHVLVHKLGGELSGRVGSPAEANGVGEALAAQGLIAEYDLRRFDRGTFTLAFTVPRRAGTRR